MCVIFLQKGRKYTLISLISKHGVTLRTIVNWQDNGNQSLMKLSIQKGAYILLFIVLATIVAVYAGNILKPIVFAFIAATIYLKPARWIEKRGMNRVGSVFLVILLGTLLFAGFGFLLTKETVAVMTTLKSELNIDQPSETIAEGINAQMPDDWINLTKKQVSDTSRKWLGDVGVPFISNTFKSTGYILSSVILSMIYTFFILIYRRGIIDAISSSSSRSSSSNRTKLVQKIITTGQQYISGLGMLILLLSILYGITFWLFGIDYPIVFAIVAATLAIIPYIGTTLGASLPVIYTYLTYDNYYIALGLVACIIAIQMLEGNLLTPKIVGGNMKLNPLASLMAVVLGNFVWGLAGMVLFLPLAAMLKVIFEEIDDLKPIAKLSGQDLIKPE